MMPNPWIILASVVAIAATGATGWHYGAAHERSLSQEAAIVEQNRHISELANMAKESNAILQKQRENNVKVSKDHEKQIAKLQTVIADTNAKLAKSGGLRVNRSICDRPAENGAKAASNINDDEATSRTISLPHGITENLLKLVDKCDEIVEQAREAQEWIIIHDLY